MKERKRSKPEPFETYLRERDGNPLPRDEEIAEAVNYGNGMKRHICFDAALLKQAEMAAAFGISEKSIERYREKGLPAYRKTHPETGHRIWYFCGQEVFFWMIEAGLAGEIETPPVVLAALARWQWWQRELVKRGLAKGIAEPAEYAASMTHTPFMFWYWYEDMHPNRKEPCEACPFLLDEEAVKSREQNLHDIERLGIDLAELRGDGA